MKMNFKSKKITEIPKNHHQVIRNRKNNQKTEEAVSQTSPQERLKQLEELYIQVRREYFNLFKECPEALIYTDIDGIVLAVNHSFEALTGFREKDLRGSSIIYSLKPEERSYFETTGREYFETVITGLDGQRLEVSVNKNYSQVSNRIAGMIFSFRGISHHKHEHEINQVLYQISHLTHSKLPLDEIYPLVHDQLKRVVVARNFYIALVSQENHELFFPYYTDEASGDNEILIQRYCASQSIFHYVLKMEKPVLMDFQRYRKMLSYGYIEPWDVMTNTHLWLAVPMKAGEEVIGVIALQSYDNARLYSEKDIELLEYIAQQLASRIIGNTSTFKQGS